MYDDVELNSGEFLEERQQQFYEMLKNVEWKGLECLLVSSLKK